MKSLLIISLLISIILIICVYMYRCFLDKVEKFGDYNNIYFFSKNETINFIIKDKDDYIKNLTEFDLYARKVKNGNEYIDNIIETIVDFTDNEKEKLTKCAIASDNFLKTCSLYKNVIDYKELINIKWIFACTDNNDKKQYEEGLPHTRENIIFLTKSIIKNNRHNRIPGH